MEFAAYLTSVLAVTVSKDCLTGQDPLPLTSWQIPAQVLHTHITQTVCTDHMPYALALVNG